MSEKKNMTGKENSFHMENFRRRSRYAAVFLVLILAFAAITVLNINSGNVNISIPEIFRILLRRTGEGKGLQDYGRYLGTAFQLIDDLLDYNADGEQLGKNVGDDLNEGKPTLPLLHAMHHGTPEQAQMIRTAIEQGNGRHLLEPVLEAMNACGSLEWTRQRAEEEADKAIAALQVLPDTPWREALIGLAHIAVQRDR